MGFRVVLISLLALSLTAFADEQWRRPLPENQVIFDTNQGQVIIELAPGFAPNHVSQFRALVREGFYDGLDFYRVIDGFVAQGGDLSEQKPSRHKKTLAAEFERNIEHESEFHQVQQPAFFADATGFIDGFPVARDLQAKREWLVHCPGMVAMARNVEPDTGSSDFYIVIGQATRHLDRNMSTFGRVLIGMDVVQSFKRGDREIGGGVINDASKRTEILKATLVADKPAGQRPILSVERVDGQDFQQRLSNSRSLSNPFFHHKGTGRLDVCYNLPKVKLSAAQTAQAVTPP